MFDDFHAYFFENVVTPYQKFVEGIGELHTGVSSDLRSALVAATSLYHLREHLPEECSGRWNDVVAACPDFELLGEIVNVAKHRTLDREPKYLKDANALKEFVETTKYNDNKGPYFYSRKRVAARLKDGSECDIEVLLRSVLNYWFSELLDCGVLDEPHGVDETRSNEIPSRSDAEKQRHNMTMIQGVRFQLETRFLEYDAEERRSIPLDVSDFEFHFRAYKPKYTVHLNAQHKETGEIVSYPVTLTDEEAFAFHELPDEQARGEFLHKCAVEKGVFAKAVEEIRERDGNEGT